MYPYSTNQMRDQIYCKISVSSHASLRREACEDTDILQNCIFIFHNLISQKKCPRLLLLRYWGESEIIHKRSTVRAYSIMSALS